MGMAENKFLTKTVAYVFHIEIIGFGAYLCVKSHMQQHIAQLFADVILVIAHQGVTKFISLFDSIGAQTFVGLLAVPGTFLAELVEYVEEAAEGFHLFFSCMHDFEI